MDECGYLYVVDEGGNGVGVDPPRAKRGETMRTDA